MFDEAEDLLGGPIPYQQPPPPTLSISSSELAGLVGITQRAVNMLAKEGTLDRDAAGRFDRDAAVLAYCAHLREAATGRSNAPKLTDERIRVAREQADHLELKNARARKELLSAVEVELEWAGILRDIRAAFLAVPTRIQERLGSLSAADVSVIDREIRDTLREMGDDTH